MLDGIGSVVRNRRYLGYTLSYAFGFSVMFAYISASPFVLQNMLGLSAGQYSAAFAANAGGLMLGSAVTAKLSDRVSLDRMLACGVIAVMATTSALAVLTVVGITLWPMLILLFATVTSLGFVFANATTLAVEQVPALAGTGSAVLGALQFGLAAVISPLVGLGGDATAVPMVIAMFFAALMSMSMLFLVAKKQA